ncbi:MAG: putative integral rane protein [Tardiphaga sp.]|nr:putative integral rane protein [Tardiphaga sp.]
MINPSLLLRRAIQIDAAVSGAMALLLTFGASLLAPLLHLPEPLLLESGMFLIGYAALVGWLGTRDAMPRALVMVIIAGNALWTLGSIGLLFSGAVAPNLLGEAFVALQAIAVGVFAELQYLGLRRSSTAQPA